MSRRLKILIALAGILALVVALALTITSAAAAGITGAAIVFLMMVAAVQQMAINPARYRRKEGFPLGLATPLLWFGASAMVITSRVNDLRTSSGLLRVRGTFASTTSRFNSIRRVVVTRIVTTVQEGIGALGRRLKPTEAAYLAHYASG